MTKAISYSLFGYNKQRQHNSFIFSDYLRGVALNVRLARVLYPEYIIYVHVDKGTYYGVGEILEKLGVCISVEDDAPLTLAMLWRMKPVFNDNIELVLCRDLDSPLTFRERQCTMYWELGGKAAHAITDSISHTIPMMGGMIGFRNCYFKQLTKYGSWEHMVHSKGIEYGIKGSDQELLCRYIYPRFATSGEDNITQHYLLGMPNTFLSDYHNDVPDIDIGVSLEFKRTNDLCGHIGAAGYYSAPMLRFILDYKEMFKDLWEVESQYKDIFYWTNENF